MKDTKTDGSYGYYSKKLQKVFDSVEELKAAEAEAEQAAKAKEEAAAKKKAEAKVVEDAWLALKTAKQDYSAAIKEVEQHFKEELAEAVKVYQAKRDELETEYKESEEHIVSEYNAAVKAYNDALASFNKAHPEGFHITFKDGDREITISSREHSHVALDFDKFFDLAFPLRDFWRF